MNLSLNIHDIFERSVHRYAQKTAIITEQSRYTYEEVDKYSQILAEHFSSKGFKSGDVIAVKLSKSLSMIVAIIALYKIGCVYLPIDINCPIKREKYILNDAKAKYLITDSYCDTQKETKAIQLNDDILFSMPPVQYQYIKYPNSNNAYVLYTSGTTGKPKGVLVGHKSAVNNLLWAKRHYKLSSKDVFIQKTNCAFDASLWELLLWFIAGSSLVICDTYKSSDLNYIKDLIERYRVTVCFFTPTQFDIFLNFVEHQKCLSMLRSIKHFLIGGEIFSCALLDKYREIFKNNHSIKIYNVYGPTETTIAITDFECSNYNGNGTVPIGKTIANNCIYLLNDGVMCSDGEVGEIFISGIGVSYGYINNLELTKERFIKNPFQPGTKMYRTGDYAKWENEQLVFIGRKDTQIKIRGYRIDTKEVEENINAIEKIEKSNVISFKTKIGEKLIAFYCGEKIKKEILKNILQQEIPQYMIPDDFIHIDEFPITDNGKIDNSRLLQYYELIISNHNNESLIIDGQKQIYGEILYEINKMSLNIVDINLNFQSNGIDSISFVKLIIELESKFDFKFPADKQTMQNFITVLDFILYVHNSICSKGETNET